MSCCPRVWETSVFSVSRMGDSLVTLISVATEAGGKGGVDGEDLAYGEDEVLAVDLAEAAAAEDDLVVAGLQEGGVVVAVGVRGEGTGDAGVGVDDDDSGIGHGGAGGVGDECR